MLLPKRAAGPRVVHASVPRKPVARSITAAPPAVAGSSGPPTRQSGALYLANRLNAGSRLCLANRLNAGSRLCLANRLNAGSPLRLANRLTPVRDWTGRAGLTSVRDVGVANALDSSSRFATR